MEDMKERTREWVNQFDHESIDPLFPSEPADIQYIAESTGELGNMRERTRERVDYPKHESIDPVLPSEFSAGK